MKNRQGKNHTAPDLKMVVFGLFAVMVCLFPAGRLWAGELAVPAEFIRYIKLPGFGETILRPTAQHYDRFHDELLVGDSGHNRILIFSSGGVFKFSFSLAEIMGTPRDITTDPEGFIYILGSDARGQVLYRFDFDGTPLGPIDLPRVLDGVPVELRYLACDEQGTLFALDHKGRRILVLGDGYALENTINLERDADLAAGLANPDAAGKGAYALGTMACAGGVLYVPVSNLGTVSTFSTSGEYLGSVGYFGSKPGTLNFPVAVEVSPEGLIMVLDRNRYCVVCYSPAGKYLGEFGGRGISPGWFMGPSLLSVPAADRVVIGQLFRNRIQVCTVPEFIRAKVDQVLNEQAVGALEPSGVALAAGNHDGEDQRRLSGNFRSTQAADGEFPPSDSKDEQDVHHVSYPEVSE